MGNLVSVGLLVLQMLFLIILAAGVCYWVITIQEFSFREIRRRLEKVEAAAVTRDELRLAINELRAEVAALELRRKTEARAALWGRAS